MCYNVPFTFIRTFQFFSIRFVSSAKFSSMSNSQCWSTFSTWFLSPLSLRNPPYLLMLKRPLDCYPHSTTSPFVLRHCDYKQQVHRLNINKIVRISSIFIDSFWPIREHYTKCFSLAMDYFAVHYRYEWFVICPFCAMCNKKMMIVGFEWEAVLPHILKEPAEHN